ncbi:M20/M25/M40 family metallo-hydrolase [Chitinophaga sp. SYP-B3965]|uniref:M20/M25/M40 family metallo-hydrolase n=1 Tax=Chitinophaga sp. SYP-B3965 TaxID=2663120 RepID=UPI001299520A|nr:M20/M25/M40 family metallo-hydrolase [Chitinophaga sp. SYP-B3965]MRG46901.1 M20/M25/M40 family metallo-hydrolase [Chitinophaga sp. SYP-B3965]
MIKKILTVLGLGLLLLITVILVNTFRKKPFPVVSEKIENRPFPDSAIAHMSGAVQIPTISISEYGAIDTAAFKAFGVFIEQSYPLVHQHLSKTLINEFSFVFEWKGKQAAMAPFIIMGHYDVVPVETSSLEEWKAPPFSGAVMDSCIWGRGSLDDKYGVICILEAAEALLRKGFTPQRTIYLCFGHDEELRGRSAAAVVQYLEQKKVRAEMVLDEGGQINVEKIKEVNRPVAVIGVAEKGYASFELSVHKEGSHSSIPDKETAIDILAAGLHRLRSNIPPAKITPPVREFLSRVSVSSDDFLLRAAGANMWLFEGVAKKIMSARPEGYAMIHTTIVPVILESGLKENIIPANAKAIINSRILPGETAQTVEDYMRHVIHDERVVIKNVSKAGSDPSTVTSITSAAFKRVESAIHKTVPNVLITPYLSVGATDSRYYRKISDGVVGFLPLTDSKGFHGVNERLPLRDLQRGINFFMTIMEEERQEFK